MRKELVCKKKGKEKVLRRLVHRRYNRIWNRKLDGGAGCVAAVKKRGRTRTEGTDGNANAQERKRGDLTAVSRRTAAALCVGGVGARVRTAAVLRAVTCGVACALGAGEEDEGKRRMVRRGRQVPPPYYLWAVGGDRGCRICCA